MFFFLLWGGGGGGAGVSEFFHYDSKLKIIYFGGGVWGCGRGEGEA